MCVSALPIQRATYPAARSAPRAGLPIPVTSSNDVDMAARQSILDAGGKIVELDDAQRQAWVDAMKPVYDKFITDARLKDLVKKVQDTQ